MAYNMIRNSVQASPTTVSDKYVIVSDPNGNVAYKNVGFYNVDDKINISSVSSSTSVPPKLGGGQVEFKIELGSIDQLNYPVLQAVFLNDTGAAASKTSLHMDIARLDVVSAGRVIWTTTGQELFLSNIFLDKNTYNACYGDFALNPNYGQAATSIANGSTQEMLMPIYGFFKSVKLLVAALQGPLVFRFIFNPNTHSIITGSEMTCQSLNLLLYGKSLKKAAKIAALKIWQDPRVPMALSHLSVDRISNTMNLTANQTVKMTFSGIVGTCAFLIMTIRLASTANIPAGSTLYQYVDTIDVLDNGGNSIIGSYARSVKARHLLQANILGNDASVLNQEMICFCTDPVSAFANGVGSGYAIITGSESIVFKTLSNMASGNYQIDLRFYQYENLVCKQGFLEASRT